MADPTTINTSLAVPTRGSDTGTWDVPVNGNFNSIDAMMGSVTSVALTSAAVTLLSSQTLVSVIRFTGTLNANVTVTLPGIYKSWTIDNQIVNSPSSFAVTLVSTSGASVLGCPPGPQDVFYDGTTINYRNLGRIGEYWDYCGSTVPTWVTASTKPPYLNCNATVFSSATYPVLANLLGTTTLPDSRGSFRATLNQATGRLTAAAGGVDGNTAYARGGTDSVVLNTTQIPSHAHANSLNDPGHTHSHNAALNAATSTTGGGGFGIVGVVAATINANFTGMTITNAAAGGGASHSSIGPTYIGGITMIRAA